MRLAVYLSPAAEEKLLLGCEALVALRTLKRWVLFLPLTSFAVIGVLSVLEFLHLKMEEHGKYAGFVGPLGKYSQNTKLCITALTKERK